MDIDYLVSDAISVVMSAVSSVIDLFNRIPSMWVIIILGVVFFMYFSRMIIAPLFGGAPHYSRGSDSARKKGENE